MVIGADNLSEYERLLALAENEDVKVYENYDLGSNKFKGLYCDGNVALSYNLEDTASKTCVLAEELGHYYTATKNILDLSDAEKSKQERKGRIWAYEKLITKDAIDVAFRSNIICSCNCFNANLLYVYIIAGNFTIHSICENEKERIT